MLKKIIPFLSIFLILPSISLAKNYNPNNVISDTQYSDYNSLTKKQIQQFLVNKGSELATLKANGKKISTIFYEAAQEYQISPKLLLVTAQKEQSTVTDPSLTDYQKKYLMGYAVYPGSPMLDKYSGMYKQITNSAWQFRKYVDFYWRFGYQKGLTKTTSDGYTVRPANHATAGLFNYTPHAGAPSGTATSGSGNGNFLFWQIWQKWFSITYPSGTLIKIDGQDLIYLLKGGRKRPFLSDRVFEQRKYSNRQVVTISSDENNYFTGNATIFPNGTLLKDEQEKYFIISRRRLRRFKSMKKFKELGYKKRKAIDIDAAGKKFYNRGKPIIKKRESHLDGTVIFNKKTKQKYLIKDGFKKPIISQLIYKNQFSVKNRAFVSQEVIESYPIGDPVLLRDGTIIRDSKKNLYYIEAGKKRPISRTVFNELDYNAKSILNAPYKVRRLHELGKKVKL